MMQAGARNRLLGLAFSLWALTSLSASYAAAPDEWLRFRLNPQNNVVIAASAEPRWSIETGAQFSSSPAIVGDVLYIGNNKGLLVALNVRTGATIWTHRAKSALMSNPLVYRGLVIVGEGDAVWVDFGHGFVCVGSGPSGLTALDAATGALRWHYVTPGSAMPTPIIMKGRLLDIDGAGFLTSLDPLTGKPIWVRNIGSIGSMVALTAIRPDTVVGAGTFRSAVFAVDPADGSMRWEHEFPKLVSAVGDCPPASDGQNVFCDYVEPLDPAQQGMAGVPARLRVYAIDGRTGARVWNVPAEKGVTPKRNESAIPLVYDGRLYVGSAIGKVVHAYDTHTGNLIWKRRVAAPVKGGLVARDGTVYFGDGRGYLWALDAKSGKVLGSKKTGTSYGVGSPVIYGDSLIIGSNSGRLSAIPLSAIRSAKDKPPAGKQPPAPSA